MFPAAISTCLGDLLIQPLGVDYSDNPPKGKTPVPLALQRESTMILCQDHATKFITNGIRPVGNRLPKEEKALDTSGVSTENSPAIYPRLWRFPPGQSQLGPKMGISTA